MVQMDRFDLIVIGSGAGTHVASIASKKGLRVALVDKGPVGGVCLNNGCVPSKMLIYPADVIRILQQAKAVGLEASISRIDFQKIMSRMHSAVEKNRIHLEKAIEAKENIVWYKSSAEFIDDYTLQVEGKPLTASKIVIATGARPFVPPIQGLKVAGYLDNVTLLNIEELPESLIIIGAGLVACEYGHFFSAMGTEVTVLGRSARVLKNEEPEVSRVVKEVLSNFLKIYTNHEVIGVEVKDGRKVVSAYNRVDNRIYEFQADQILLAAGRRSNSDLLKPELTGVEVDQHGWIKVNEYLETTKKDIWAIGDAIGKHMFRHTASYESNIVIHNILQAKSPEERLSADFRSVPHAVFTNPQVASVGLIESKAIESGFNVLIGRAKYTDVAKGMAMAEESGFVKIILEEQTGKILGCTIVGPGAPELIQQVVYIMNADSQYPKSLKRSQVIHPTLNEVLIRAIESLEHPINHIV